MFDIYSIVKTLLLTTFILLVNEIYSQDTVICYTNLNREQLANMLKTLGNVSDEYFLFPVS